MSGFFEVFQQMIVLPMFFMELIICLILEQKGSFGFSDSNNPKYHAMVEQIRENLDLTTLKFQKLDDLVEAIGLPKEKLCTHCWDGSSYF